MQSYYINTDIISLRFTHHFWLCMSLSLSLYLSSIAQIQNVTHAGTDARSPVTSSSFAETSVITPPAITINSHLHIAAENCLTFRTQNMNKYNFCCFYFARSKNDNKKKSSHLRLRNVIKQNCKSRISCHGSHQTH